MVDRVGGKTFLVDEFFDLNTSINKFLTPASREVHTKSSVLRALADTKGRTHAGIRSEAVGILLSIRTVCEAVGLVQGQSRSNISINEQ